MFFGRDHELALLDAQLQSMMEGNGVALFLTGEAGIGKTTLVREWWDAVQRSGRTANSNLLFASASCSVPVMDSSLQALDALQPFAEIMQVLGMALSAKTSTRHDLRHTILKIAPKWIAVVPIVGALIWAGMETYDILQERKRVIEESSANTANQR